METIDERTFKQKVHEGWVKTKNKVEDTVVGVKRTISEHPMESLTIAMVTIPGVLRIANSAIRAHQQNMETRYNECDIYDPRTGTHYYTKRPLSNNQKLNLENEYKAGRNKGEILRDMKML